MAQLSRTATPPTVDTISNQTLVGDVELQQLNPQPSQSVAPPSNEPSQIAADTPDTNTVAQGDTTPNNVQVADPIPDQSTDQIEPPTASTSTSSTPPRVPKPKHQRRTAILRILNSIYHSIEEQSIAYRPIVLATLLFVAVTYITLSSTINPLRSPLGSMSPQIGTFLLSVLAKITDYAFQAVADLVREKLQWGPLLNRGSNMLSFLAMGSTFSGWRKALLRKKKPLDSTIITSSNPRVIRPWYQHSRFLGVVNIGVWALIQFPGIIFMTEVNPETGYRATNWTDISGGLGLYDPKSIAQGYDMPAVTQLVTGLLQDPKQTIITTPLNEHCKGSKSCKGFLLTGGLTAVAPWPYYQSNDPSLELYIVKDAPAYQVDVDILDPNEVLTWKQENCVLYGPSSAALELCIGFYLDRAEQLVARWRACLGTISPSGECSLPWPEAKTWTTTIAYNRVLATTKNDRYNNKIVNIERISNPKPQIIGPLDIFLAIDTLLCPFESGSTLCIGSGVNALFTGTIQSALTFGTISTASTTPLELLQNLLVTPLILFNPVTTIFSTVGPAVNDTQPNLPPENYIKGSLAKEVRYVAPEPWTVYVYIAVAAFLLVIAWTLGVWAGSQCRDDTSSFPFVDMRKLQWRYEGQRQGSSHDLSEIFTAVALTSDRDMMAAVIDKKVERKPVQATQP